jgi:large subunit ribosomal protein L18
MSRLTHKRLKENRRANRVRTVVIGTTERPRLSVNVSNLHISAQIIDDTNGKKQTGTMSERAVWVGNEISKLAKKATVSKVVFDRGSRKYHGRIKALADAARTGGLEF